MSGARLALALALATAACRREAEPLPAPPGPAPVIRTSSAAAFRAVRQGARPTFAAGDLYVYVQAGAADLDLGLPGVAFGDARGPRYGLLGGYFTPRVLAPDTQRAWPVRIDSGPAGLRVVFEGGPDVEVRPDRQVILRGDATLAFPADDAAVSGTYRGEPAVALSIRAGGEPRVQRPRADRLAIATEADGTFALWPACPRLDVTKAVPRGSTSVFLVHVGPAGQPADPLYAPELPPAPSDRAACSKTGTSTLTLPRRG